MNHIQDNVDAGIIERDKMCKTKMTSKSAKNDPAFGVFQQLIKELPG